MEDMFEVDFLLTIFQSSCISILPASELYKWTWAGIDIGICHVRPLTWIHYRWNQTTYFYRLPENRHVFSCSGTGHKSGMHGPRWNVIRYAEKDLLVCFCFPQELKRGKPWQTSSHLRHLVPSECLFLVKPKSASPIQRFRCEAFTKSHMPVMFQNHIPAILPFQNEKAQPFHLDGALSLRRPRPFTHSPRNVRKEGGLAI